MWTKNRTTSLSVWIARGGDTNGHKGVTEAAGELQRRGAITYKRGKIEVLDRDALESTVCECYGVVKKETDRLLGAFAPGP